MELCGATNYLSFLERLPLDIIEVISGYLSVYDLAACCATSSWMRETFGCDSIWRRRCDRQLAVYLERTPCKTKPHFRIPDDSNGTLSPISYWRQCFMKENRLWKNWKTKNYALEILESQTERSVPKDFLFFGNDIIILRFQDRFEFWNVRESPHVKAVDDIKLTPNNNYKTKVASDNDILILHNQELIIVFKMDFSSKKAILEHAFFYHEQDNIKNIKWLHDIERIISARQENQSERLTPFHIISKSLILSISLADSNIHIWNYCTGIKVKVDPFSLHNSGSLRYKTTENFLYISTWDESESRYHVLAYDLNYLSYTPFNLTVDKLRDFVVTDDFVAVCYNNHMKDNYNHTTFVRVLLSIYCRKSCQIVLADQPIHDNCEVIKNKFVFVYRNDIHFFCPYSKSLESFPLPNRLGKDFSVINDTFLLIGSFCYPEETMASSKAYEYDRRYVNETNLEIVHSCDYLHSKVNANSTRIFDGRHLKTLW